jgi:hypothetical protein
LFFYAGETIMLMGKRKTQQYLTAPRLTDFFLYSIGIIWGENQAVERLNYA